MLKDFVFKKIPAGPLLFLVQNYFHKIYKPFEISHYIMIKSSSDKIQLPINTAYFTRVKNLKPDKQALLQNVEWYAAGKDRRYSPGIHLLTRDLVVTKNLKDKLMGIVNEDAVVLVGDLTRDGNGCRIEGRVINEIIERMERREQLLGKRGIVMSPDGTYPSLLKRQELFHDVKIKGHENNYSNRRDIKIILAIDGTNPDIFANPQAKRYMAHAIDVAGEFAFQQKYFFASDELSIIVFGENPKDITQDYLKSTSWVVKKPRNTAKCLEHCVETAGTTKRYHHIYLVTTGASDDPRICDAAVEMRVKGIGLTQFLVGDKWKQQPNCLAQVIQSADDSKGDFYVVKSQSMDVLSLIVNEHYERYRANLGV